MATLRWLCALALVVAAAALPPMPNYWRTGTSENFVGACHEARRPVSSRCEAYRVVIEDQSAEWFYDLEPHPFLVVMRCYVTEQCASPAAASAVLGWISSSRVFVRAEGSLPEMHVELVYRDPSPDNFTVH